MNWLEKLLVDQLEGTLRHFLSGIGGAMVADGVLTQDQNTQIVGGVMALGAVAFSWWQKHNAETAAQLRSDRAYHAGAAQMAVTLGKAPAPAHPSNDPAQLDLPGVLANAGLAGTMANAPADVRAQMKDLY